MTLKSPYFDAQHLDQAVLCLAIAEVQHDDIQEIVLPLLCAILQRYIYYKYQIIIFVFLINFAVHSFSHQAQPELRRALIERATTAGRNATPSIPSAFTFGNTFRMIW